MQFIQQQTFLSHARTFFRGFFEHLHDHVVPHPRNNYHPHLFGHRAMALFSVLLVTVKVLSISLLTFGPVLPAYSSAITAQNIISLTNDSRKTFGLTELKPNELLNAAAQAKANDMLAKGYFAHTSPDGRLPWDFITTANYNYLVAGENLAVNFSEAENVEEAWMNSPGHKANILNKNFEEIGIGIAEGVYQGKNSIFVVQMFGTPAVQKVALQQKPTPVEKEPVPAPKSSPQPVIAEKQVAGAVAAELQPPVKPLAIQNTHVELAYNSVIVKAVVEGEPVKVMAVYGEKAVLMQPQADGTWLGSIESSALTHGGVSLMVKAYSLDGKFVQSEVAKFSGSTPENYQVMPKVQDSKVHWFGQIFNPKQLENTFYLGFMAVLLTSLVIAIAIRRHVQHVSVVANGAFVVMLACLLWVMG